MSKVNVGTRGHIDWGNPNAMRLSADTKKFISDRLIKEPKMNSELEREAMDEEYYVHRKGTYTGNAPSWWAKGGRGYTSYVQGAERFTKRDAEALLKSDPSKWAIYRCKDVDARLHLVFDMQDTRRLGTSEPCGWPFGYAGAALSTEAQGEPDGYLSIAQVLPSGRIGKDILREHLLKPGMMLYIQHPQPPADTVTLGREEYEALKKDAEQYLVISDMAKTAHENGQRGFWVKLTGFDAARTGKDE